MRFPAQKELLILELLLSRGVMYALKMTEEDKRLKLGTVYATLYRMEKQNWVKSYEEDDPDHPGLPRRYYELTGEGERVLRAAWTLLQTGTAAPARSRRQVTSKRG